jgi:hypothetical protein
VLVVAGVISAIVVDGGFGQVLALVLIGLGLVAATSLVFFEVGLSEDRERAREEAVAAARRAREGANPAGQAGPARGRPAPRPRLGRMRGQSRRLER